MKGGEKQVSKLALSVQMKAGGKGSQQRVEGEDWGRVGRAILERRREGSGVRWTWEAKTRLLLPPGNSCEPRETPPLPGSQFPAKQG